MGSLGNHPFWLVPGDGAGGGAVGTVQAVAVDCDEGATLEAASISRYLGLDVGSKRIGVAVSDELGLTAQPVLTLTRKRNLRDDLRSLARLCRRFECVGIVVGDPVHLSGEASAQATKTRAFAEELGLLAGLPVHLWDERLTSREAHEILYAAGKSRQEHKPLVDQMAAMLILQSFMDSRGNAEKPAG